MTKSAKKKPPKRKAPGKKAPGRRAAAADESLRDRIRRRAFELFEARGPGLGSAVEDWLQAEEELLAKPENE